MRRSQYCTRYICEFILAACLIIGFSCKEPNDYQGRTHNVRVVVSDGYVVPQDSMKVPVVIPVDENKLNKVLAGQPGVKPTNINVHPAGKPKVVVAGTPRICTPGQDSFSLPRTVAAIDSPFIGSMPEVVIAKEMIYKDRNPANFSAFGKIQGLKHGDILCMLQDDTGNLWFGTAGGGVSRHDGRSFTHFTEKEGLSSNFVLSMLQDDVGNLWFGTRKGVTRYDGTFFTHFSEAEGFSDNTVLSMLEDDSGNLWFGTRGGGVTQYHPPVNGEAGSFTNFTEEEGLSNNVVRMIFQDDAGRLWFGTDGGLSRYDGNSFTQFTEKEGLLSNYILSMLEDVAGNLWFGTWGGGISHFDGKSFTHFTEEEGLSDNFVWNILQDDSDNLWVATNSGGVTRYDGKTFTQFTETQGLSNNSVRGMLQDDAGNLWFGTYGGGVSRYGGKIFTHYTTNEGLLHNIVWSILQDDAGNLWFGTDGGGVSRYDGTSFTHFTTEEGLSNNNVRSMLQDDSGNLWFGTDGGGVSRYEPPKEGRQGNFTRFTEKDGLSSNFVLSMLQDDSGNFWIGTYGGGVSRYEPPEEGHQGTFTHFTEKDGLSNNAVKSMLQDHAGNLWFGTNGGVSRYERPKNGRAGSFTKFTEGEGLSNNIVNCVFEDDAGNLWFGTDGGVSRYERSKNGQHGFFMHFTEEDGLSNNFVFSILQDNSGNLWFGTRFGLSCLSAERLATFSDSAQLVKLGDNDILFRNYTYEDGLIGIGCNSGAILQSKDSTIWIGTNDRLTAYHPQGDLADHTAPNIRLTGLRLFNEVIAWPNLYQHQDSNLLLDNGVQVKRLTFDGLSRWYNLPEHLSLAYNNNDLTFDFIGITMHQPHRVQYQYKLEGMDANWSARTSNNTATYTNLPHGEFIFKVKAMNSMGNWSNECHYPFTIRPPWWKSWWAYMIYGVLLILAIWQVHRYQRARTVRAEREKSRQRELAQAREIENAYAELETAHEHLKTTQTQLVHSEKMASLGELTAGIAHEIKNPLNFVNNFSEVNKELIIEMQQELDAGNLDAAKAIARDIAGNEEKIKSHGARADAIVKSMLQHSRTGSGDKEPTDINALADEYLRLAYHGLRALDKSFNAEFAVDFDETLPKVNIVRQDIGRVLLNLFNNAFYACTERKSLNVDRSTDNVQRTSDTDRYQPLVTVTTKRQGNTAIITVADNGNGIAQNVIDKIFQPFFTTKPTGEGTGLGLSLVFDIVTKGHGGDISVQTTEGEGTKFTVTIPISVK